MEPNNDNSNTNYPTFQESQIEQSNPLGAYSDSPAPNSSQVYEKPSFQNPLIRDIGSQTPIREEGHIYALDLNSNKFLYTINPYGDYRYCFIFEPLKRMNVALSFDLAYLEIWNLESVQCNTKIFMFETQRVFELDNCQLVLMSKRGIRVVNAKY